MVHDSLQFHPKAGTLLPHLWDLSQRGLENNLRDRAGIAVYTLASNFKIVFRGHRLHPQLSTFPNRRHWLIRGQALCNKYPLRCAQVDMYKSSKRKRAQRDSIFKRRVSNVEEQTFLIQFSSTSNRTLAQSLIPAQSGIGNFLSVSTAESAQKVKDDWVYCMYIINIA